MRIGILTFHHGANYGGILQCYALQTKIREKGHSVEVINYVPSAPSLSKRIINKLKTLKSFNDIKRVLMLRYKGLSQKKGGSNNNLKKVFDEFRKNYINLSPRLTDETIGKYANEHYDAVIVGSDQVWTELYSKTNPYFIGWTPDFKGKRISYAACSAHNFVKGRQKTILKDLLSKFDKITVRDQTTAELVNCIIGATPEIVPDPTELHDFKELLTEPTQEKEPYILSYVLGAEIPGGHKNAFSFINDKTDKCRLVSIISNNATQMAEISDDARENVSPVEWLDLIRNARLVYTDSFHAILFCLKFNVPFIAYYSDPVRSSRLIYLKRTRNLKNIISKADEIKNLDF